MAIPSYVQHYGYTLLCPTLWLYPPMSNIMAIPSYVQHYGYTLLCPTLWLYPPMSNIMAIPSYGQKCTYLYHSAFEFVAEMEKYCCIEHGAHTHTHTEVTSGPMHTYLSLFPLQLQHLLLEQHTLLLSVQKLLT